MAVRRMPQLKDEFHTIAPNATLLGAPPRRPVYLLRGTAFLRRMVATGGDLLPSAGPLGVGADGFFSAARASRMARN